MNKQKSNTYNKFFGIAAVAGCLAIIGVVYIVTKGPESTTITIAEIKEESVTTVVEPIESEERALDQIDIESLAAPLIAPEITEAADITAVAESKIIEESIEVPMAGEPEKPSLPAPTDKPQTDDDLSDLTHEPSYSADEIVYAPEETIEPEMPEESVVDSNLVPDSENPFLRDDIPTNGNTGAVYLEDITDYVPGTGDKF